MRCVGYPTKTPSDRCAFDHFLTALHTRANPIFVLGRDPRVHSRELGFPLERSEETVAVAITRPIVEAARMGQRIAISGRLSFPASRASALKAAIIDARQIDPWPTPRELFGARSSPRLVSVADLTAAFEREEVSEVRWELDGLQLRAIVRADAESWLGGGFSLMAMFRMAGALGASGGLGITGWIDGEPSGVISIMTKPDGSNSLSVMQGHRAENAAKAIHAHVAHLVDGASKHLSFARLGPNALPLIGYALEHHRSVARALGTCDPKQLYEIARALDLPEETETFAFGDNPFYRESLTARFRDEGALLRAFDEGWPGASAEDGGRLAKRALELLARLDGGQAKALAFDAIRSGLAGPVSAWAELFAASTTTG